MVLKLLLNTQMIRMVLKKYWRMQLKLQTWYWFFLWYDPTIVTELFIRGGKLNIYLVFIAQSYFVVPKNSQLNSTHSIISISNKQKLQ